MMTQRNLSRLQIFFRSKVLNKLSVIIVSSLPMIGYTKDFVKAITRAAIAFTLFTAYSLWFWI